MINIKALKNSGSKGNCFLIDNRILIDVGITFKELSSKIDIRMLDFILLTHLHSDHINKSTLKNILINSNAIIIYDVSINFDKKYYININKEWQHRFKEVDYTFNRWEQLDKHTQINTFNLYHDINNVGYRININGHKIIYASDTSTLSGIKAFNYDVGLIECNHDEFTILNYANEYPHIKRSYKTHLSVNKAIEFIKDNHIKKLIPIHMSNIPAIKEDVIKYLKKNI